MLHLLYLLLATARSSLKPQRELAVPPQNPVDPTIVDVSAVPPRNPVDRTIVEVSLFGIKLTYPHTSLGVRPARNRQFTTKRIPHVEPSATHMRV
jgi:hypothetical protein